MKHSNDEGCGVQEKSEMKQTNRTQAEYKVNLGCGAQVVDGWVNVDYAIGARLSRIPLFAAPNRRIGFFNVKWDEHILIHDLRKPLPFKSNSVYVVYSFHTLEHFDREDGRRLLSECYRVLRTGGLARIVVPDLRHIVSCYIDGNIPADKFCEELRVYQRHIGKTPIHRFISSQIAFPHKCMYDQAALLSVMTEIGFQAEVKTQFDSAIPDIRSIEMERRSDATSVIVEGVKG
jgi:predicted SAM-dependent methyltransferase